ncbi:jg22781, partial [Pararge aegeria aegeria]
MKENIVRKPACLRVLHNVLNTQQLVKSTNTHCASVVDYGLQPLLIVGGDRVLYWA